MRSLVRSVAWLACLACGYPSLPALEDAHARDAGITLGDGPASSPDASCNDCKDLTWFYFTTTLNRWNGTAGLAITIDPSDQAFPPLVFVNGTISGTDVIVEVPRGTDRSSLVASFVTTGARVEVMGVQQENGVTSHDFTAPITYRVVAVDNSTKDYNVVVVEQTEWYVKPYYPSGSGVARFGSAVSLSADGVALAVGAPTEDMYSYSNNMSIPLSGRLYVFERWNATWLLEVFLYPDAAAGDALGASVALSSDSTRLAAGSPGVAYNTGSVVLMARVNGSWLYYANDTRVTVSANNAQPSDRFGSSVALSSTGTTLAVGAPGEDSGATGIGGSGIDNSADGSGAVYVFDFASATWSQHAYVKASNTNASDAFGTSIALSADGNTLAIGAPGEASAATGIGGNQADNTAAQSGAVYVFTRSGNTWTQQAYVKASNTNASDAFGTSLALAANGNTLVVGAPGEASAATGIGGSQADNSAARSGAVYVLTRSGNTWTQQAYVKASNTNADDLFGTSVSLSSDGNTLAVGAPGEASAATGIATSQSDNSAANCGALYVFTRSGTTWSQRSYAKGAGSNAGDLLGTSVAVSGDGGTFAAGAKGEAGAAISIGGDPTDNSQPERGAVFAFPASAL